MKAKSFAVGVRMEHPQESSTGISTAGPMGKVCRLRITGKVTRAGSLKTEKAFIPSVCVREAMVNASSSEQQMLAVNGMSYHSRVKARTPTALMVATVGPEDFGLMRSWRNGVSEEAGAGLPMKPGKERFRCSFSVIS